MPSFQDLKVNQRCKVLPSLSITIRWMRISCDVWSLEYLDLGSDRLSSRTCLAMDSFPEAARNRKKSESRRFFFQNMDGWLGRVGGRGEGRSKQASPVCQLFACNYPLKHLKVRPQKTRPRDLPLSGADICKSPPSDGRAPDCRTPTPQYHAWSKKLPVTTDYHFLNPHHHQPHPFSIFVPTYFGRICEQSRLDLYVCPNLGEKFQVWRF